MPIVHRAFFTLCSTFRAVTTLSLRRLTAQTFVEIVYLINRFPRIRTLQLNDCEWPPPSQYPQNRRTTEISHFQIDLSNEDCRRNIVHWLFPIESQLRRLEWWVYQVLGDDLPYIQGKSPMLREISLTMVGPEAACGMWLEEDVFVFVSDSRTQIYHLSSTMRLSNIWNTWRMDQISMIS